MPDAINTHMHRHKSWIAGSEAHFLWAFSDRVREGTGQRGREGEREGEGVGYKLSVSKKSHQFRLLDTNCSHPSAVGPRPAGASSIAPTSLHLCSDPEAPSSLEFIYSSIKKKQTWYKRHLASRIRSNERLLDIICRCSVLRIGRRKRRALLKGTPAVSPEEEKSSTLLARFPDGAASEFETA